MAKDSTAVRKLIELSQQKPIDVDLGGLFDGEPPRSAQRAPLPPPRASGIQPVVAPPPLPRTRTPAGTQSNPTVIPPAAADGTPAPERIENAADELFGAKPLPPLPTAGPAAPPPPQALPPRRPSMGHAAQPAPQPAPPPRAAAPVPPQARPVAPAPVEVSEMEDGGWFQQSEAVPMVDDFLVGTQAVEKSRGSAVVAIAAAFGLGIVAAGGYLVYQRINAKDAKSVAASTASTSASGPAVAAKVEPVSPSIAAAEKAPAPAAAPAAVDPAAAAPAAPAAADPAAAAPAAPTVTSIEAAPAPAAAAAAAAPAPAAAAAAPVAGSLIDVVLKSEPEGVTVMLIDGGGAVKLGKTPTTASLSSGAQHQILFSRDGYTATIATIDPAAQTDVMVALAPAAGGAAPAAAAQVAHAATATTPTVQPIETAPAAAPAPAKAKPQHVAAATPAPAPAAKSHPRPAAHAEPAAPVEARADHAEKSHAPAAKRTATAVSSGGGTLMIGAKPPCEIIVDGRATGLTTPQRAINLPAGAHNITLVNKANNIKKSFSVAITAGSPTKVVKDFTALMSK